MSGSLPVRGGSRVTVIALVLATMTVLFGASRSRTTAAAPASPSSSAAASGGPAPSNAPAPSSSRAPPAATEAIAAVPANAAPLACADRLLHPLFDLVDAPERRGAEAAIDDESDASPGGDDASAELVRHAKAAARDLRGALGSGAAFDAIVATIVDPIDSGMSYRFDAALEALSLGIEESADGLPAYFRDRSWLPWDDREASPAQQVESRSCRTTTPGLLVFRTSTPGDIPAADRPVALLLFLVGETPTTGIHVDAMVSALRAARALTCADPRGCSPIQLVAPTFSGSVSSLRIALEAWEERSPSDRGEVHIVTGSATGSDVPRLLASLKLARHEVTFTSTTAPTASAECAYLGFLQHHLGIEPEPRSPGETFSARSS